MFKILNKYRIFIITKNIKFIELLGLLEIVIYVYWKLNECQNISMDEQGCAFL